MMGQLNMAVTQFRVVILSLVVLVAITEAALTAAAQELREHIELGEKFSVNFASTTVDSSPDGAADAAAAHQQSTAVRRFERSLARVQPLLQRYGYGAAFAAVMAEGMGIPTPGQTLLMAGAAEAVEGRMSIALLVILVTIAATLGNSVGYAIGRWGGRAALNKLKVNSQRQQHLAGPFGGERCRGERRVGEQFRGHSPDADQGNGAECRVPPYAGDEFHRVPDRHS